MTDKALSLARLCSKKKQLFPLPTHMARLAIVAGPALQPASPPHPYTYSPIISIIKARLVIVAGPASLASSHFLLSITPFSISSRTWVSPSHQLSYTYSPIISIIKARLVIVAGSASFASSHFFLSVIPLFSKSSSRT